MRFSILAIKKRTRDYLKITSIGGKLPTKFQAPLNTSYDVNIFPGLEDTQKD